jgi:hypothetical protein
MSFSVKKIGVGGLAFGSWLSGRISGLAGEDTRRES